MIKAEPGTILLVLSDERQYYFHSLIYIPDGSTDGQPLDYSGHVHVGNYVDSFHARIDSTCYTGHLIEIAFHPHYRHIQFYMEATDGKPLFIANAGKSKLTVATSAGLIKLEPGEKKQVTEENAEPDSYLYARLIIQ